MITALVFMLLFNTAHSISLAGKWQFALDPKGVGQTQTLAQFPTRFYSEWQCQDLVRHSRAIILDGLPGYKPIVQPIDSFDRNYRLGTLFELKVGLGNCSSVRLICSTALSRHHRKRGN
jgi:hypothetical protein